MTAWHTDDPWWVWFWRRLYSRVYLWWALRRLRATMARGAKGVEG